jgi:(p)ppGpp synthase/HD superfamily hydrolase
MLSTSLSTSGFPKLTRAISFAVQAHSGDYRDGAFGLPYVTHPVEVLTNLRYIGGVTDEDMLCVAVLHDVLEETSVSVADLEREFGSSVAALVQELTRYEPTADETAGLTKAAVYEMRSGIMLDEIRKMSEPAQAVKLADRLANIRQAKVTRTKTKQERYIKQTEKMLEIIPKRVNIALWKAISAELG